MNNTQSNRRSKTEITKTRNLIAARITEAETGEEFHPGSDISRRDWAAVAKTNTQIEKRTRYVRSGNLTRPKTYFVKVAS